MNSKILFTEPIQYVIRIDGIMDESIMDIIENYMIRPEITIHSKDTAITGHIKDQSALSGLLNVFYSHRYIILSVQQIEGNQLEGKY